MSDETSYRTIFVQGRGELRRELAVALRTGQAIRVPRPADGGVERQVEDTVLISEQPVEVADRAVPGHWDSDLVTSTVNKTVIGTLVERHTRFVLLLHLPTNHRAPAVAAAIAAAMGTLPAQVRGSLTGAGGGEAGAGVLAVQGIELARNVTLTIDADLPVYFCDPRTPWLAGSNENTNSLLRQYFPKGTSLAKHAAEDLAFVAAELNARPRKTLGYRTPAEVFAALLSTDQSAGDPSAP